jgi:hypothetical protein
MIIPRSLKTTRNEKKFAKYLLIIDLSKFDPLTATGMALCVNLGRKCQNLFPLVSD